MTLYEFMADNQALTTYLAMISAVTTYYTTTKCAECLAAHKEHK